MADLFIYKHRRGTFEQWQNTSVVPAEGEIVVELDYDKRLHKLKIGDGKTPYADLAYLTAGGDVVTQALTRTVWVTLYASRWEEVTCQEDPNLGYFQQELDIDNIAVNSKVDLQPTADMVAIFKSQDLAFVTTTIIQDNVPKIMCYSIGSTPTHDYTLQATVTEVEAATTQIIGNTVSLPVSLGALAEQDVVERSYLADDVRASLDKADTAIQDLNGYATEDYVTDSINQIDFDGKSAYEVAVDNGFDGTEEEWLISLNGKGIAMATINADGELVITYTDGTEHNLGKVVGEDGSAVEKGDKGDKGDTGADGLSAYEVAVENGYEGSEVEWLESLKGADGTSISVTGVTQSQNQASGAQNTTTIEFSDGSVVKVISYNGIRGAKGEAGQSITMAVLEAVDGSYSELHFSNDSVVRVTNGKDGATPVFQCENNTLYVSYDDGSTWQYLQDIQQGVDGREIELRQSDTNIEWRYIDENDTAWRILATLDELKGADGNSGTDGREVEIAASDTYIQWKYADEDTWQDLVSLASISGAAGPAGISIVNAIINSNNELVLTFSDNTERNLGVVVGAKGADGAKGDDGYTPVKGVDYVDGTSVTITDITESTEDGGLNVVTFSDGQTLTIRNGSKGNDGDTPQKYIDYFTADDKAEIVAAVIAEFTDASEVAM